MEPLLLNVLAVIGIHYIWQGYLYYRSRQQEMMRERIAYMLWMAAHHAR